jgi:hypothetical protein
VAEDGKSWLKYGCFGCLGCLGLLILFVAGMFGVAALRARNEQVTKRELTPDLPAPITTPEAQPEAIAELDEATPGRVVLDLRHSGFVIAPGEPGEPLRVEATFDERSYELVERFEPEADPGWIYEVTFRRKGFSLITAMKEALGGTQPEVYIFLPPDIPFALEIDGRQGAVEAELGGLWLTSAELDFNQGALEVGFSEPLRAPMEELKIEISMGAIEAASLGNASPAVLDVEFSMGGAEIDLRGQWVQDSQISIDHRMGGGIVRLPDNVLIEGLDRGGLRVEPQAEIKPPTLTFSVSSDNPDNLEFID